MRYILLHRTEPRWEAGTLPSPELIARVGELIGELSRAKMFVAGEGLRASSLGVRLSFHGGKRRLTRGPFQATEVVASSFLILRTATLDEAVDWATRVGQIAGDLQIELRPVTEPWDIGLQPPPPESTPRRYMALIKDPIAEAGGTRSPEREALHAKLVDEMTRRGVLIATIDLQPTSKGARLQREGDRFAVTDGPYAESKELIAGYLIVDVPGRDEAIAWAHRYAHVVGTSEVDVRPLRAEGREGYGS
ncbi:MAG: hypothetical protein IRZ16_22970 [Myxococcaceae bacterium]|nr:hypothetical protein [Myxococcaceae bacterium]